MKGIVETKLRRRITRLKGIDGNIFLKKVNKPKSSSSQLKIPLTDFGSRKIEGEPIRCLNHF
jgi:hypothetical protein